jgi:hypothetical protein
MAGVLSGRQRQAGWVVVDGWFLALPVGRSFDDEFVGGGDEPVDGGLGQQRVGQHGQPFVRGAVGGHDGGGFVVAFDAQLVEVGGAGPRRAAGGPGRR